MTLALQAQWISCATSSSAAELLEECKRLCPVNECSPAHALKMLARSPPDAVVFDFDDPSATDLQLLQSVKRQYPSVPILMITESHSEELAVWAFRARVWNYMVKPVPLRELKANLDQIAKLTRRREPVARHIERPGVMLPTPHVPPDPQTEEAVMQRIIHNIRCDHTARLSIAQLARACRMSRFSFSRLFRRTFGCSCREYVMRLRIETACRMLEAPHASITSVAIAAGFTDASYFARIFRRQLGSSPKEYTLMNTAARQQKQRGAANVSASSPAISAASSRHRKPPAPLAFGQHHQLVDVDQDQDELR
jgi:AraC-like DNA-binding protein